MQAFISPYPITCYDYYFTEFEGWKAEIESSTNTCYIKCSGMKVVGREKVDYYYCNRSGYYDEEDRKGIRATKSQGTSKVDSYCTAKIVLHYTDEHVLKADITSTHYGHTIDLGHLRLSKQQRQSIAGQLLQGVSFDSILDKIRDSIGSSLQRIDLLTKKDLYNIERSFHLRGCQRHSNDYISVQLWVKEMESKGQESPVLFYKQQGKVTADVGTNNGLKEDDFALVIQTPLQSEMLQCCGDKKIVCLDATHGTNSS